MFFKMIRQCLGNALVVGDRLTRPKPVQRSPEQQALVDTACADLTLYHFKTCPFCIKVKRRMHCLNLPIKTIDAQFPGPDRDELTEKGGKAKVPCLRIRSEGGEQWMYESNDIIAYLEQRFGPST